MHVVKQCPFDAVLGTDFIMKLGRHTVDLVRRVLEIGDNVVPLVKTGLVTDYTVRTVQTVEIPPRCQMLVECTANCNTEIKNCHGPLFEPCEVRLEKTGLFAARTFFDRSARAYICFLNSTEQPARLYSGMSVGKCCAVRVNDNKPKEATVPLQPPRDAVDDLILGMDQSVLTPKERAAMTRLLRHHSNVFVRTTEELGRTDLVAHPIDTEGHAPFRQRPYRAPYAQREVIDKQVKDMLDE